MPISLEKVVSAQFTRLKDLIFNAYAFLEIILSLLLEINIQQQLG